jgi:hypothetical protein
MDATSEQGYVEQSSALMGKRHRLGRGWRRITWVIIAWSTLVVVGGLAISGHTANKLTSSCQNTFGTSSLCQQVGDQTASQQFEHIMKIGVVGFIILSIVWFMTRPQQH